MLPLVAWLARGGLPVSLALYHNSQAVRSNPAIGRRWMHSYDTMLDFWTDKKGMHRAAFIWGDHTVQLFASVKGVWMPQDGYRDLLEGAGAGFVVTLKARRIRLEFSQHPAVPGRFQLAQIVDSNGNALAFTYDARNRLSQMVDPSGRTLKFNYSASADALDTVVWIDVGLVWRFVYGRSGRLIAVIYPPVTTDGGVQTFQAGFEYNAQGNIVSIVDRAGQSWQYGYRRGRLAWAQPPANTPEE